MRDQFKAVQIRERCFLYPLPVVKENKYLLEIPRKYSDIFIWLFQQGFLKNPQGDWTGWKKGGLHTDGKTPLYELEIENLAFTLLSHPEEDLEKAKTIESLLIKKIKRVFMEDDDKETDTDKTNKHPIIDNLPYLLTSIMGGNGIFIKFDWGF